MKKKNWIFINSIVLCLFFLLWGLISPKSMEIGLNKLFNLLTDNLNWLVLLSTTFFLVICIIIAFSKYGKLKLGKDEDKPEYSTFSWFTMMFTSGMGIGLIFWSMAEPISHYMNPPYGRALTGEAAELGVRYTFFHFGLHAWGLYAFGGLALAYFQFRKGLPGLISSAFHPLLKEKSNGWAGVAINTLAIVATLTGLAVTLGFGTMQIHSGLTYFYGVSDNVIVKIFIIAAATIIFTFAAATGIEKGIKLIASLTVYITIALMLFLIITGPTNLIFKILVHTTGGYLQNIIEMSLWMNLFSDPGWINDWTVFYWAWCITWVPFVAQFIARISKGRTVKQFILGTLIVPTLFSAIWISVFSGAAFNVIMNLNKDLGSIVKKDIASVLFHTLSYYPISFISSIAGLLLVAGCFITSANSGVYVLGMFSSNGSMNPKNSLKLVWGIVLGAVAAALLGSSGLRGLQNASLISAIPFLVIMLFMVVSLLKAFKSEKINQ